MKTIIYCRVSTKEQVEKGYSLEAQRRECERFALKNEYEVDCIFIEKGESAKTQNRTELIKLIRYAIENKKKLSTLIIWKFDRLSRNLRDQIDLITKFHSWNIRVLSTTENNDNNAAGRFQRNVLGAASQYENELRGERTKSGMKQAVLEGYWCWPAPVGYKFAKNNSNKSILVLTEESKFIKEAFELAETGLYKQTEIVDKLKRKGFKRIRKQYLNRILRNPIYASLIRVRKWFPKDMKGKHEYLVSEDTFFKVQAILNGKRPSITPRLRNHPDFPLRNFIRCAKCGQQFTGSWSTGRKKVRYPYYHHRTTGCSLTVRKKLLESKFIDLLESVQPKEEILELFEAIVKDVWKDKQQKSLGDKSRLQNKLRELEIERKRIDELIIKGTFDDNAYTRNMERIEEEVMLVKIEFNDANIELNDVGGCINYCKFFLSNCASLWVEAELNLKQRFQNLIFPQGICYDGKAFGTTPLAFIFNYLHQLPTEELHLAPRAGLEPTT